MSSPGASSISRSVSVGLLQKLRRWAPLRPITIRVTPDSLAYSAICVGTSSPRIVTISAPICWASRVFSCNRSWSSSRMAVFSGVCT